MIEYKEYNKNYLSQCLFLIGLFLKQFYLLPSGSFQVGDLFIGISFILFIVVECNCKLIIFQTEKLFLLFFSFVVVINFVYSVILRNPDFNRSSLYYLYNVLVVIMFSYYLHESNSRWFYIGFIRTIQLSFVVQGMVLILGIGRWFLGTRYMGTFNDPNQYGVFILMNTFLLFLLGQIVNKKMPVWIIIGAALIFPSASTGMLVGLGTFVIVYIIRRLTCKKKRVYWLVWMLMLTAIFMLMIIAALLIINGYLHLPKTIIESNMIGRFQEKLTSMRADKSSIISNRCWEPIFEFPKYILFGAGDGGYERFGATHEIHSSILGPLFCYGIIPWTVLMCWCMKKMKGINKDLICVYIALASESLFLVNTRQPLFWIIFLFAEHPSLKRFQSRDLNL